MFLLEGIVLVNLENYNTELHSGNSFPHKFVFRGLIFCSLKVLHILKGLTSLGEEKKY